MAAKKDPGKKKPAPKKPGGNSGSANAAEKRSTSKASNRSDISKKSSTGDMGAQRSTKRGMGSQHEWNKMVSMSNNVSEMRYDESTRRRLMKEAAVRRTGKGANQSKKK